ncbi:hypothetical protein BJF79_48530 [Actinomadura sp. CNU-125]|uniref:hypothetical protein n=1 Tax=Actinomadura sp. CNU-125 TaxID=1904961 RepID=UPI000960B89D|nr:hypothetical protein [Actinomadura sp. CNU-125]OLT17055.1 hypothetical protein BJF79_48530 [Actinomadura sp. CNU-125]
MPIEGRRTLVAAVAALAAAGTSVLVTAPVMADSGKTKTYQAVLDPLNGQTGSGTLTLELDGRTATIVEHYSGLAGKLDGRPYPHLQHIHGGARGECPAPSADTNGDGVVSTVEGKPAYGPIRTTLSVRGDTSPTAGTDLEIAPHGAALDYQRVIELDDATLASLREGTAVVVVHGLDPSLIGEKARNAGSELVPSLPLAATAPALCGALRPMAAGGADTGAGGTAGPGTRVLGLGLLALSGAALALAARRRPSR